MPKNFKTEEEALEAIEKFISLFNQYYAEEIQRLAKENLNSVRPPFGNSTSVSGNLANSIIVRKKSATEWVVIATAPYAEAVEEGSLPHWVPIKPLLEWAARRLGNEKIAYAVQQKIAKEGTRPQPFMGPAMDDAFTFAYQRAFDKVFL